MLVTDLAASCAAVRQVPSDGLHLKLPLDLWQRIFALLSPKEWAKVSGTCRFFRGIQLGVLDMHVNSHNALRWAGKHWQASVRLGLVFKSGFEFSCLPPEVLALGNLQLLRVSAVTTDEACPMWLGSLLTSCKALQVLFIDCGYALPFLPPLMHLRHLVLILPAFSGSVLMGIGMLHGLVSLSLEASKGSRIIECPQIDVASLMQLKDICIERIKPNGIVLPEDCALHLVSSYSRSVLMGDALGNSARIASLKYCDKHGEFSSWPTSLMAHSTSLHWSVRRLGTAESPLPLPDANISCLRELCLESSTSIHLHIPASVHLTALHISAQDVTIRCEDADAAVAELAGFSVAFVSLLGFGVMQMQAAFERQGRVVRYRDSAYLQLFGDALWSERCVGIYLEGSRESYFSPHWSCSCNACQYCVWFGQ